MAGLALAASLAACSTFKPTHHIVPGPSGAIGAAMLANGRAAVLAGTESTRAVFIIDTASGAVVKSFGVTKEATGVSAATPAGPLLVSVGGFSRGRPFGAVELWSLDGKKLRVIPTAGFAIGITTVVDGLAYVLIGNTKSRAAQPLVVQSRKIHKAIPLAALANGLQLCRLGARSFLVYSIGSPGTVTLHDTETGAIVRSAINADSPTCLSYKNNIFAISKTLLSRSIVVISVPGMLQASLIPASNDVIALYETPDHHLLTLNTTGQTSDLETFPDDALSLQASR